MIASNPSLGFQPALVGPCSQLHHWSNEVSPSADTAAADASASRMLLDWNRPTGQPGYCPLHPPSPLFRRRYSPKGTTNKMVWQKKEQQPVSGQLYPVEAMKELQGKAMTLAGIYVTGIVKSGVAASTAPPVNERKDVPSTQTKTGVYHSSTSPLSPFAFVHSAGGAAGAPCMEGGGPPTTSGVARVESGAYCPSVVGQEKNSAITVFAEKGGMVLASRCIEKEPAPPAETAFLGQAPPRQQVGTGLNHGYRRRSATRKARSRQTGWCGLLRYLAGDEGNELN